MVTARRVRSVTCGAEKASLHPSTRERGHRNSLLAARRVCHLRARCRTAIGHASIAMQVTVLPEREEHTMSVYVIRAGDTLSGIAKRRGIPLKQLLGLNPQIKNADLISIGMALNLPGDEPVPRAN